MRGKARFGLLPHLLLFITFVLPPALSPAEENARRLVTLAPSISEIVFALGKGENVVGVSRFCNFPAEVERLPKFDSLALNLEALLVLKPSLVIHLADNAGSKEKFSQLGLSTLSIEQGTLEEIFSSFTRIGQALGAGVAAEHMVQEIKEELASYQHLNKSGSSKRVLLLLAEGGLSNSAGSFFAVGRKSYLSELLGYAGAENAYRGELAYPQLSLEGILALKPDVIIELAPGDKAPTAAAASFWKEIFTGEEHNKPQVFHLTQDYLLIPGPRVAQVLAQLARVLQDA